MPHLHQYDTSLAPPACACGRTLGTGRVTADTSRRATLMLHLWEVLDHLSQEGPAEPPVDVQHLTGSTDAMAWAEAFVAQVQRTPSIGADAGAMVGWFANAIEAGRNAGYAAMSPVVPELTAEVADKLRGRPYGTEWATAYLDAVGGPDPDMEYQWSNLRAWFQAAVESATEPRRHLHTQPVDTVQAAYDGDTVHPGTAVVAMPVRHEPRSFDPSRVVWCDAHSHYTSSDPDLRGAQCTVRVKAALAVVDEGGQ